MPRKGLTPAEELRALKEQQPILEENVRIATRTLNANVAKQRQLKEQMAYAKRQELGTKVSGFDLTEEEILEALAAKKREIERGSEEVIGELVGDKRQAVLREHGGEG